MAKLDLETLIARSAKLEGPSFCPKLNVGLGGVDPLGMRQINFDLMDKVLPNLNNVARHIRPLVVIAWAWRRARQIAENSGSVDVSPNALSDFVDRIDMLYVWSQLLVAEDVELPGAQVLQPLLNVDRYEFGGDEWEKLREGRRYSTALTGPLNYGPLSKSMGWILPHQDRPKLFVANSEFDSALDAFEAQFHDRLGHPIFSNFGQVSISTEEVRELGKLWSLQDLTAAEKRAAMEAMKGKSAPAARRHGIELMEAAYAYRDSFDLRELRKLMSGSYPDFQPDGEQGSSQEAWRQVQVRQAFRLALESLFYWIVQKLAVNASSVDQLVSSFISCLPSEVTELTAAECVNIYSKDSQCPVEVIEEITRVLGLRELDEMPAVLLSALSFCLLQPSEEGDQTQRSERLPLWRAKSEFVSSESADVTEFLRYVFEVWVLGQHAFWAIGRGLSDARSGGKLILRLKVTVEEDGWALVPGASKLSPPNPTPDRLESAVSLAQEYGLGSPAVRTQ